jgi:hypothetical protein
LLATGRVLTWHESKPGGKLTSLAEHCSVPNRCDDCRGPQGPYAGNSDETPAVIVALGDELDILPVSIDLRLERVRSAVMS